MRRASPLRTPRQGGIIKVFYIHCCGAPQRCAPQWGTAYASSVNVVVAVVEGSGSS